MKFKRKVSELKSRKEKRKKNVQHVDGAHSQQHFTTLAAQEHNVCCNVSFAASWPGLL